ncbi:MAG: patatin family protein [Bacillota bacterium]|nr:patatin family protein [Bacillota bacterium]
MQKGHRIMEEKKTKNGIVLEGGGMRGMYTAGVLDVLMENGITFDGLVGVSAGAIMGTSFASGQNGRSIRYYKRFGQDKRFMSMRNFFLTGDFVGVDFSYHELPDKLDPFDYEAFRKNPMEFYCGCSNMETGKSELIRVEDLHEGIDVLRASATLPYISRPVEWNGQKYMDGGCTDSIPVRAFRRLGFARNVVVLTRDQGYRKKAGAWWLPGNFYRRYPEFAKQLRLRFAHYNREVQDIEKMAEKGEICLIRPSRPLSIGRVEADPVKLQEIYDLGRFDAQNELERIRRFLSC